MLKSRKNQPLRPRNPLRPKQPKPRLSQRLRLRRLQTSRVRRRAPMWLRLMTILARSARKADILPTTAASKAVLTATARKAASAAAPRVNVRPVRAEHTIRAVRKAPVLRVIARKAATVRARRATVLRAIVRKATVRRVVTAHAPMVIVRKATVRRAATAPGPMVIARKAPAALEAPAATARVLRATVRKAATAHAPMAIVPRATVRKAVTAHDPMATVRKAPAAPAARVATALVRKAIAALAVTALAPMAIVRRAAADRVDVRQVPGVPDELKEKIPEAPRANFAERAAFEKETKRDDKREPKKDTTKTVTDNKDKHRVLKQQAQALSGQGVSAVLSDDNVLDTLYKEPAKGAKNRPARGNRRYQQPAPVVRAVLTHVTLPESLTVKEFAEAIKKTAAEVIKKLIKFGIMATVNQEIDFDTATIIAEEFGITTEKLVEVTEEEILFDDSEDAEADLKPRPPVVVVMGHVDHGKTSILDRIRSSSVATGEAGGITQHIGAYTVRAKNRQITFLDTPGHEAFTTMRARGAQVTDIAILVVAADDGVMPQTVEAINHARAANTQIVVALNKIDKEGANLDRVKQELSKLELIPEEWGGTTVMVPVSAKTGQGMDELLEMVLLTADILDLKANPDKQAKGTVIEAKLDKNRGPVATVLVQRGTLRTGDTVVSGSIIGHVRAMTDDKGNMVKKAGPSIPVEILGMPEVPEAGEIFYAVTDEKVARTLADRRRIVQREQQLRASSRMSLDTLFTQMAAGEVKDLNIIVKADVQGSVEAVRQSLEKLSGSEVRVRVIHGAVGAITESDVRLAEVSNAIVIGFNVRPAANVADLAKDAGVDVRMYRIIYNAIDDIEAAMKGMLAPKFKETVLGHAQVRQVFKVTGVGSIAGCYVTDGKVTRSSEVRIVRDGIVIHEGKLASLKRFKDDAREVATGYECGISIDKFNDIKENDVIEAFEMTEIERS